MKDEEIGRALSTAGEIVPSSGFAAAVMEAIRLEAAAPPPIPFPWKWAIPGLVAWAVAIGAVVWIVVVQFARATQPEVFSLAQINPAVLWAGSTALALVVALFCFKLSMRLAGSGS